MSNLWDGVTTGPNNGKKNGNIINSDNSRNSKNREQVAVGPGFLKHHIFLYFSCIG